MFSWNIKAVDFTKSIFLTKIILAIAFVCFCNFLKTQTYVYGKGEVNWNMGEFYTIPLAANSFSNSDLLILKEFTDFYFYSESNEKISSNITYKVNTEKGLEKLKHFRMPESFDFAFDQELYKQGRNARIKVPYTTDYKVKLFSARKFSNNQWKRVALKRHFEQVRWIKKSGEFANEDVLILDLDSLEINDVVEIYYEAEFKGNYGSNIFYITGPYPKLFCEYKFDYLVDKRIDEVNFILPINVDDGIEQMSKLNRGDYVQVSKNYRFQNLLANTQPFNSLQGNRLPHVCVDFDFYQASSFKYYNFNKNRYIKPNNFEWIVLYDTIVNESVRLYDKHSNNIRKFLNKLPNLQSDTGNFVFYQALMDTLNNFRFITANQIVYNESHLSNLFPDDHLMKRRISNYHVKTLFSNILMEKKQFYYLVNIQDKRLGEHLKEYRSHFAYERNIFAMPIKNSIMYLLPKEDGVKYHFNELPFYYEGVLAAFFPMNFQNTMNDKNPKTFSMIRTGSGNCSDNSRAEICDIAVNRDSLLIRLSMKEKLSGQFSTIIRHKYLNNIIDSTISLHYFKKCTDKPNAFAQKLNLNSFSTVYPFQYNFKASEKIRMFDSSSLSIQNWFSFPLNMSAFKQFCNNDYFFDFDFSDTYNYLFSFNRATEILNKSEFETHLENEYYTLTSEIKQNSTTNYQLLVTLQVQKPSIPKRDLDYLLILLQRLDSLNNITFKLANKTH